MTIAITLIIGIFGIKALNSAFRHTESIIKTGFSQAGSILRGMHEVNMENAIIMALGSKGDRPGWGSFLKKAKEEAVNIGYLRITKDSFVTTPAAEKLLPLSIQEQIQEIVKGNPETILEELAAIVVEKLGLRVLTGLARATKKPVNVIIAIVAGFAERIRTKE